MYFHVQIKQSLQIRKTCSVFLVYSQGQKGTGRADIYIFLTVWRFKGTSVHLQRCIPDVWYWWWLLILLDFADILYFLAVLVTK